MYKKSVPKTKCMEQKASLCLPLKLTTDTKVALLMSGTSLGGGDSPFVRLGLRPVEEEGLKKKKNQSQ